MQQSNPRLVRQPTMIVGLALGLSDPTLYSQPPRSAAKLAGLPTVAFIRNADDLDGAGCSLWLLGDRTYTNDRYIFVADFGERALMNIRGHDTALRLVDSSGGNGEPKKGDRSTYHCRGGGADVVVRYLVTGVCGTG